MNKLSFKRNIIKLEDAIFTQGSPSDAVKYKDLLEILINYVQQEYYTGVYHGQAIQEGKFPNLELPTNTTRNNNQPDAEFDMEVFKWKENTTDFFRKICNI